jgi:hypothetical protein
MYYYFIFLFMYAQIIGILRYTYMNAFKFQLVKRNKYYTSQLLY